MYNSLTKNHMMIPNRLSLVDRVSQPGAYYANVLNNILRQRKYFIKPTDACNYSALIMHTHTTHVDKKPRLSLENTSRR